MTYDILIIGAGPAGLTAAANAAARGLKTLILEERQTFGGQLNNVYPLKTVVDLPGFPQGIQAGQYAKYIFDQMKHSGAEIRFDKSVVEMKLDEEVKVLTTDDGETFEGKRVIICTGHMAVPRRLPQIKDYKGDGVTYILREPMKYSGKKVLIVGGGNTAIDNAYQLSDFAESVTLIHRGDTLRTKQTMRERIDKAGIKIRLHTELKEIIDKNNKVEVLLSEKDEEKVEEFDAVVVNIGYELARSNLDLSFFDQNEDKSVKVDSDQHTSIPGVFAAGDVTGEVKLITVACSEGIVAAVHTFKSIRKPYWQS